MQYDLSMTCYVDRWHATPFYEAACQTATESQPSPRMLVTNPANDNSASRTLSRSTALSIYFDGRGVQKPN